MTSANNIHSKNTIELILLNVLALKKNKGFSLQRMEDINNKYTEKERHALLPSYNKSHTNHFEITSNSKVHFIFALA